MRVEKNFKLKNITTMAVGGPAKFFIEAFNETDLKKALYFAKEKNLPWYIIGDGSNLIPNDKGYKGVIIRNKINYFIKDGNLVEVGAGNNLLKTILKVNNLGLAGFEKIAGIPGSIGGAIYGCAGAYGQEIKDYLIRVKIFDGRKVKWISSKQCRFNYRESIFTKNKNWVILAAQFKLNKDDPRKLNQTSKKIIKLRKEKYWPNLLCPGSFFKNIVINNLKPTIRKRFLSQVPPNKIIYNKVPSGYLLEVVGARGLKLGQIGVAKHHANLIFNLGKGKSADIIKLARILKHKVKKRFQIELQEEIQYI